MVTTELLDQSRAGDGAAFGRLVEPYRRELLVHCYRMLGSLHDAEDALQETLVTAWTSLAGFEGRSSLRSWLYRVATTRCLNMLRSANRRPLVAAPQPELDPPTPTRLGEVMWLEPYPDELLNELADTTPGPEARYEAGEAISLAFVTVLQLLPPRQRTVLVLRDVLGFSAREVAEILESTVDSVTSALRHARAALHDRLPPGRLPAAPPNSPGEQLLVSRLAKAWESGDVDGVVALLTDDVWLSMPPLPLEYQGRELAARFLSVVAFRPHLRYRLVPTRANGQPAFGAYRYDAQSGHAHAAGLLVLTLAGTQISAITHFDNSMLPHFGLPRTLRDPGPFT